MPNAAIDLLLLFEIDASNIPPPTGNNFLLAIDEYFLLAGGLDFLLA